MTIRASRTARLELAAATDHTTITPLVQPALMGDQHGIFEFLTSVFHAPTAIQFQNQLDDPFYEPSDRQLLHHQGRIAGHVRVVPREIRFGGMQLPVAEICELVVASALRRRGFGALLLRAAERRAMGDKAVLGFVRSAGSPWFQRRGWVPLAAFCYSQCNTREMLARLSEDEAPPTPARELAYQQQRLLPISTRIWRHVEREALMRIYDANTRDSYGPVVRSEDYWNWLISRPGFGQVYVAVEGRDRCSLDNTPLVGYAVVHRDRVVELMADPRRPDAIRYLLARVGGEFIEHDFHNFRLEAPANSSQHELLRSAGGQFVRKETDQGQRWHVRILDPRGLLERMIPVLADRARRAQLPDCELSVVGGEHTFRFTWQANRLTCDLSVGADHQLLGDAALPTHLMLAQISVDEAQAAGRLRVTSEQARAAARVFFAPQSYWHTPLDYFNP
ncbi:MAG: GNAT family N-acetyltransferase [Planctomycetota bacterium]